MLNASATTDATPAAEIFCLFLCCVRLGLFAAGVPSTTGVPSDKGTSSSINGVLTSSWLPLCLLGLEPPHHRVGHQVIWKNDEILLLNSFVCVCVGEMRMLCAIARQGNNHSITSNERVDINDVRAYQDGRDVPPSRLALAVATAW